jgi:hypothetical protein
MIFSLSKTSLTGPPAQGFGSDEKLQLNKAMRREEFN